LESTAYLKNIDLNHNHIKLFVYFWIQICSSHLSITFNFLLANYYSSLRLICSEFIVVKRLSL